MIAEVKRIGDLRTKIPDRIRLVVYCFLSISLDKWDFSGWEVDGRHENRAEAATDEMYRVDVPLPAINRCNCILVVQSLRNEEGGGERGGRIIFEIDM